MKKIKQVNQPVKKNRNHYFFPYFGNKRNEVEKLYEMIQMRGVNTIVEPFAGSQAISYYIWTMKPNIKFILNDNNPRLKELYEVFKCPIKTQEFIDRVNPLIEICKNSKEEYVKICKENTIEGFFICSKYYNIRPGLYPSLEKFKPLICDTVPIIKFYREADIIFTSTNGINIYNEYKDNKDAVIILDPPYINTNNDFYYDAELNIYEYLYNNDIGKEKAKIYLILEDIWIIKLLFKKYIIHRYEKKYETTKKQTNHLIISNKRFKNKAI